MDEQVATNRPDAGSRNKQEKASDGMPVISKFYGIVIRMLCVRAFGARFYAFYGDSELVVNLWPVRIVAGDAPARVQRMVVEWARQHEQELLAAWHRCQIGMPPRPVAPLA